MSPQVVTLGEAMLRLSPSAGGRLQEADSLDARVAGAEANVASALASLGVETAWISALPETPLGRRVARGLLATGVDLDFVEWQQAGRVGLFFIEFGAEPRPTSVWYDREDSAFTRMTRFDPAVMSGARFAVTSGITLALCQASRDLATSFLAEARATGVSICLDVNYRERLCSRSDARSYLEPVLAEADIVICSRSDAKRVFGLAGARLDEVPDPFREQFAPGAAAVAITDGDDGCAATDGTSVFNQAAIPTQVVDRIGAGDAFFAGLLWGLLDDEGLERSLRYAAALGALACTVVGDQSLFTAAEVRASANGSAALIR